MSACPQCGENDDEPGLSCPVCRYEAPTPPEGPGDLRTLLALAIHEGRSRPPFGCIHLEEKPWALCEADADLFLATPSGRVLAARLDAAPSGHGEGKCVTWGSLPYGFSRDLWAAMSTLVGITRLVVHDTPESLLPDVLVKAVRSFDEKGAALASGSRPAETT